MKLIIDIPEWKYKSICEGVEASKRCGVATLRPDIDEAIYNGTPLDSVRAKIADVETYERDGYWVMRDVWKVLNDIDEEGRE